MTYSLKALQALLNTNIGQNNPLIKAGGGSAQAAVLSWGLTSPVDLPGGFRQPDIIIAADVVYHREIFEPLMSTLSAFGDKRSVTQSCSRLRWQKCLIMLLCALQPTVGATSASCWHMYVDGRATSISGGWQGRCLISLMSQVTMHRAMPGLIHALKGPCDCSDLN